MWGKRRAAEDVPETRVQNSPLGGAAEDSAVDAVVPAPPRFSDAIAMVQLAPSRDAALGVRSSVTALNGASRRSEPERAQEAPASQPPPAHIEAEPQMASAAPKAAVASAPKNQGPTLEEIRFAVTFTRIVSVLSRSPQYKHYSLSDLEWLVVPPILTGQCAVMEANVNGRQVPVAVALWASVSEEVDKRLSENLTSPLKVRPDEWRSGEFLWLIEAVGDSAAVYKLLTQVQETIFKERNAKMRRLQDSQLTMGTLRQTLSG